MILSAILFFLLSTADASTSQNGIVPSQFKAGYFSFGAETTYLSTKANYNNSGKSADLISPYKFGAFQSLLYGRYDFTNEVSFFAELPLNYTTSENVVDKYSAFNAPGITLGANYNISLSGFNLIPQFKAYYAIEQYDANSTEVLSSDGVTYLDVGTHAFMRSQNFILHGFMSYQYRMEGFSSLLNYQVDATYRASAFSLVFGTKGFESITDDDDTNMRAIRELHLLDINGGSLMYGAVNPSRLDLFTQAKFAITQSMDIYGGVSKSLRGKNSADLLTATVGLEYFFGSSDESSPKVKTIREKDTFDYADENIDPAVEEKIKSYNKPVPPKKAPRKRIKKTKPKSNDFTQVSDENELVVSRKQLGKKSTSTSPMKAEPRSKKTKRVNIDF